MPYTARICTLILGLGAVSFGQAVGDSAGPGWRVSPEEINIEVGADRPLQVLDDLAHELHGATWSVDAPYLATIRYVDGRVTVNAKAAGTVLITATLGSKKRYREIRIWDAFAQAPPPGITGWRVHPIGSVIRAVPAVPTLESTNVFVLERAPEGMAFLRGINSEGLQDWVWQVPERSQSVDLVCGDWLGGALISVDHGDSFTLYSVNANGSLRWQRSLTGVRKAHAYNLQHLAHILHQSPDGTLTFVSGLDESTGELKFTLELGPSHQRWITVQKTGSNVQCVSEESVRLVPTQTSYMFVGFDGLAYVAFTHREQELRLDHCTAGAQLGSSSVKRVDEQHLLLWQIHPDGTYRSTVVEESRTFGLLSDPPSELWPTGSLIPAGSDGAFLSVGWSHGSSRRTGRTAPEELVYRLDSDGKVVSILPLPAFDGARHDGMLLGENGRGFATRGSTVVGFNTRDGMEIWRWDSHTPDVELFATLSSGGCLLQTSNGLIELESPSEVKEVLKGRIILNWQNQVFRTDGGLSEVLGFTLNLAGSGWYINQ